MSVLAERAAVPSRITAPIKYLLGCPETRDSRQRVHEMLSPPHLRPQKGDAKGDETISKVLDEAVKAGLLVQEGEKNDRILALSGDARQAFPSGAYDDIQARLLLTRLLATTEENREFCLLLAWLLAQDYHTLRGNQANIETALRLQVGDLLKINDVRFGNLRYWAVYLGLAWLNSVGQGSELVPDPTRHIEWLLPQLFVEASEDQPLQPWLEHLAQLCPMLQGGSFERSLSGLPPLQEGQIRPPLGLALLRLEQRGVLGFSNPSDAKQFVVIDNGRPKQISRVRWAVQPGAQSKSRGKKKEAA